jgi:heme-degrading monooxygenase HmoA
MLSPPTRAAAQCAVGGVSSRAAVASHSQAAAAREEIAWEMQPESWDGCTVDAAEFADSASSEPERAPSRALIRVYERETHLAEVPGFVRFALLRGETPGRYVSHSTWQSRAAFEAWTRSEAFRKAHAGARMPAGVLRGHPRVELFDAVLEQPAPTR